MTRKSARAGTSRAQPARAAPAPLPAPAFEGWSARRCALAYGLPLLLLLALLSAPLVRGTRTLYLRDVVYTHLEMKWAQAVAMHGGYFPVLDPWRGGGQALAGNPNVVPFYPTNLLFLVAPAFWALNAHFWIHLLLAPLACFWMARRWGLAREGAWATAACYAVSGFYLSHLSLYNLIAGATLTPALVAACLGVASGERRAVMVPVTALLWGLLLVGGDPLSAAMALPLAVGAVMMAPRPAARARSSLAWLGAAIAWGTVMALPQLVEFLRVLPHSFRGQHGYDAAERTIASLDPRQIGEWILPFLFGRPDVMGSGQFWGHRFYLGTAPYFLSFYPGLLAFALVSATTPRARGPARWAWAAVVLGAALALGRFDPVARILFEHPALANLRFPIKFWLPAAVGCALLCGIGFQGLLEGRREARRNVAVTLAALAALLGLAGAFLWLRPLAANDGLVRAGLEASLADPERRRWLGLILTALAVTGLYAIVLSIMFRNSRARAVAAAVLIGAHVLTQLVLLRPLYPMDSPAAYRQRPAALSWVPESTRVMNPDQRSMFGPTRQLQGPFPSHDRYWQWRRAFAQLYPMTGPIWSRHFDLDTSPEGLASAHTVQAQRAVWQAGDTTRVRLLATWGIERLVLDRPLVPPSAARLLARAPGLGAPVYVYEIPGASPKVMLVGDVYPVPDDLGAAALLSLPDFNPRRDVALLEAGPPRSLGGGTARVLREGPEALEIETTAAPGGAILVVQRTDLLYGAEIDGRAAPVRTANIHRIGIEVPEGRHRVRVFVDRRPLQRSAAAAGVALLLLPGLGWIAMRRGGRSVASAG